MSVLKVDTSNWQWLLAAAQTCGAHNSGDAIAAMAAALPAQALLDARTTMRLPTADKNGGELPGERLFPLLESYG